MNKKLLQKTTSAYLVFASITLIIAAPVFYFFTNKLYIEDADEALLLSKNDFVKQTASTIKINEIPVFNKYNLGVKVKPNENLKKDTLFYSSAFEIRTNEMEPFRELNAPITIDGQPFTYVQKINLIETDDLIENIVVLFLLIIGSLILGIFFITKKLSQRLWKPFYETLALIENFEIDKKTILQFSESTTQEFNRLNTSIQKLIERNTVIYKSQKEFIENAAHELQTPLAVFKAKIDTFFQRNDITPEQALLLTSINESAARLIKLNKNLLLLSKIENESFGENQKISLNEILLKQFDFFEEQAKSKNISIDLNTDVNVEIISNPVLAEICINNLFLNAIKHNTKNGKIFILFSQNSLTFSNTGADAPLESDKLFKRFSKINPSSQGNGLGLAIVKKIAELNKWEFTYQYLENLHQFSLKF
jgi:signal transduction histidine kinase